MKTVEEARALDAKRKLEAYWKDPVAARARLSASHERHRSTRLEEQRAWRLRNLERERKRARAKQAINPAKTREITARRKARKLRATPAWANKFFIAEIYELAQLRTRLLGVPHHVDHIVPLQSAFVCGLHVEHNLRVIPAAVNWAKNNRFTQESA